MHINASINCPLTLRNSPLLVQLYWGLVCTTRCQNIWETSKVLNLKNSTLSSTNFWSSFLMSQNCPTMSLYQEAIASSTSSLIWGVKEFTEMVESLTRPWSSLSCFETTPSIKVSKHRSINIHIKKSCGLFDVLAFVGLYRGAFLKVNAQQPNFQEWLCFQSFHLCKISAHIIEWKIIDPISITSISMLNRDEF